MWKRTMLILLLLCGIGVCAEGSRGDPVYDEYYKNHHKTIDKTEAMQLSDYDLFWEHVQAEYVRLREEDQFWEEMEFSMENKKKHSIDQVIFNTIIDMNFAGNRMGIDYWTTEDQHKLQQLLDHYQVPAPWSGFLRYGSPSIGELTRTAAIKIAKDMLMIIEELSQEDLDGLVISSIFNVIDPENPQWELECVQLAASGKPRSIYFYYVTIHARTFEIVESDLPEVG